MIIFKSLLYFCLTGICEIGGGYLIWQYLRAGKSVWVALLGAILLIAYGFIATLQPTNFGRTYAQGNRIKIRIAKK